MFITNTGAQTKIEVEVYTVLGQKILSQQYDAKEEIKLKGLSEGLFIIKISIDEVYKQTERLIMTN